MRNVELVPGDTVVWNPENFNPAFWDKLSERDRIRYYGDLGYGSKKRKLFTFLCHHRPQHGHCVLVSMDGKVETMRHTSEFDLVGEDEC